MDDIFAGYGIQELDDLRTAVDAVHRAIDTGAQDEHAGAGTLKDAVGRISAHLVDDLGDQRSVRGLAALVYGLTIDPASSPLSWKHSASDRIVDLLKDQGGLEHP